MSRKPAVEADDIWTKLSRDKVPTAASSSSGASGEAEEGAEKTSSSAACINQHLVFMGDMSCGKSTLIQTFLKPNAAKESKPTVALDYNYARKVVNNNKFIANFWEIGGDLVEPRLLEIPITKANFHTATAFVVCDLSKPQNVIVSTLRSISAIREVLGKRTAEIQASDVSRLTEIRERIVASYKGHPDANRVRPTEVPIVIVANKHDALRGMPTAERRCLLQALRFVAHYFGASLLTMASGSGDNSAMRDAYRAFINAVAFTLPGSSVKPSCETNLDKLVFVTRGQDSFENILLGANLTEHADSGKVKYRMVSSEAELDLYLTHKGVSRDCWNRLSDHIAAVFGEADPLPSMSLNSKGESKEMESGHDEAGPGEDANPYPETEIDDMRGLRDASLLRYVQEAERKQEMLNKMNAPRSSNA